MNPTQDAQDAAACLRQFQFQPAGCSAQEIALAEGIPLDRCHDVLTRLQHAHLIERLDATPEAKFCLSETVTALDVLNAIWVPMNTTRVHVLFETSANSARVVAQWSRGQWAQG